MEYDIVPSDSPPPSFVIIGCGHAGSRAAVSLRKRGFMGEITLIGAEKWQPYEKPPLSKGLLAAETRIETTHFRTPEFYEKERITLRLGALVTRIDRDRKRVIFSDDASLAYDKLLLATGSKPRRLAVPGATLPGVFNLHTIEDSLNIRDRLVANAAVTVIGAGYIGLEIAAAASKARASVTILEAAPRVLARVASAPISEFFATELRARGVDLRVNSTVCGIAGTDRVQAVVLEDGTRIPTDVVIVGIGSDAADALALDAGLSCGKGVVVDQCGRTQDPAIFAAGDVTFHYDPRSAGHRRLECVQNATGQAEAAANAMLGIERPHCDVPTFWSDQGAIRLQIAGLVSVTDQIALRGDPSARRFSVLHLKDGVLSAVEAVNCPKDFLQGKQLILAGTPVDLLRATDPETPLSASVVGSQASDQ